MKSKISPYPTSAPHSDLALAGSIRQILRVKRAGVLVAMLVGTASAGPMSNPAFMGIGMSAHPFGCHVDSITRGSAAEDAGLQPNDLIAAIDGLVLQATAQQPYLPCDVLRTQILSHPSGDVVRLDLSRLGEHVVVNVTLSTRAEVLHRRFVGHAMDGISVSDIDDDTHSFELDQHGKTTVVGWFSMRCVGCTTAFERVFDGLMRRTKGIHPLFLAVTHGAPKDLRKLFATDIALANADEGTFRDLAIDDERVQFMVIDCRGIVRFVSPVAPDGDDLDAAVDEVLAAAEQAEHARVSRR